MADNQLAPSSGPAAGAAKKPNVFVRYIAPTFTIGLVVGLFGGAFLAPMAEGLGSRFSTPTGGGATSPQAGTRSPVKAPPTGEMPVDPAKPDEAKPDAAKPEAPKPEGTPAADPASPAKPK